MSWSSFFLVLSKFHSMSQETISIPDGIKGLIFDLDGTLIDSMPLHYDGYNYALEPWGVIYPKELFLSRAGIPTLDTMHLIAKENDIQGFDSEIAMQRKRSFVDTHLDRITLIEPIFQILKDHQGRLPISVGTGSNRATVTSMFQMFDLDPYIPISVTATDVTHFKPHPETFLKCAELMEVDPADCLVFEDGVPGIKAAETAGMQVVDVTQYL